MFPQLVTVVLVLVQVAESCFPSDGGNGPRPCPCSIDSVALLNEVGTFPGSGTKSINPIGTPTVDDKGCPTAYKITCEPTTGTTVIMEFQDMMGGAQQTTSVELTCENGDFVHKSDQGTLLVISVQCMEL
ncbi:unnamed protein product [Caenorhabditis bovis]|uniref:C6 domain-containing protein n=1 Tax=Caenorhabditis bovis TaxID=2654633 RepID=A0A8S1F037_9PELO|nr:unnamed protein product [Caenorhabditis bovis]